MDVLKEKVKRLHYLRMKKESLMSLFDQTLEEMESTPEGQKHLRVKDAIADVKAELADTDNYVRREALTIYEHTGDKIIMPGIGIREMTRIQYDEEHAREWCLNNNPVLMRLDTRRFEKFARAVQGIQDIEVVSYETEFIATVSSDLSEAADAS